MKAAAKKVIKKILRRSSVSAESKPDPKDYSTTTDPQEVPCQKDTYYMALNTYVNEGDEVLDVGVGLGYGMTILSIKAGSIRGVDVDKKAVKYCQDNLMGRNPKLKSVAVYDGYNLPFKDKSFDVVTCVDVLEHVEDYHKFIDELMRVARKVVLFGTPNRRPEYTNPDGTPKNYWHLREWSHGELDAILKERKRPIEWHFINGPWEGPFTHTTAVKENTMVLAPAILCQKS